MGGVNDDDDDGVEYNIYNADEEITDGGYMSFDRLPKDVRTMQFLRFPRSIKKWKR